MSIRATKMRAFLWKGKTEDVLVKDVPIPAIRHPKDVIVRVTLAALCRTDLQIHNGELSSTKDPWILGHEAIGIVIAVGSAVDVFKFGDRVVVPDAPSSGELRIEKSTSLFGNTQGGFPWIWRRSRFESGRLSRYESTKLFLVSQMLTC
jgi:threonine dehydrogenase-like Zn-dependent dehydrogenase